MAGNSNWTRGVPELWYLFAVTTLKVITVWKKKGGKRMHLNEHMGLHRSQYIETSNSDRNHAQQVNTLQKSQRFKSLNKSVQVTKVQYLLQ